MLGEKVLAYVHFQDLIIVSIQSFFFMDEHSNVIVLIYVLVHSSNSSKESISILINKYFNFFSKILIKSFSKTQNKQFKALTTFH